VRENGAPAARNLWYAYGFDPDRLWFISRPTREHCANLRTDPRIDGAILAVEPDEVVRPHVISASARQDAAHCGDVDPFRLEAPVTEPPQLPPPQPPYGPYPAQVNMYAILSLVFAIFVFPPLGIYFGKKAKEQIARTGERGIELANAGVICGWIFSILLAVVLLIWCGFAAVFILAATNR
jgi:hypothetical protein